MDEAARTQPMKRKKAKAKRDGSFARVLLITFLLFVCLVLALVAVAVIQLPVMAEREYGPASPRLSLQQRVIYSFRLLFNRDSLLTPYDPTGLPREFQVELGESVNSIAFRLESERFISNADAFRTYLIYSGLDTGVQAGRYQLSPAMSTVEIAQALQDPVPEDVEFNILPGWRAEEIADALPTSGLELSPEAFLRLVNNPPADLLPDDFPALDSLEGFLMPGSYIIPREASAEEVVALFVQNFADSLTPEIRQGFRNQGLDLVEAVTLASIVEREAVVDDEQPLIASVFYNRLMIGMKLDSDPTVQYAVGKPGNWWTNPLTIADLQFDSSYNTYIYPGLPPGPIANPGLQALRSVAYPAQTGYYYFRAQCNGSGRHSFAVTYEEHLNNACP